MHKLMVVLGMVAACSAQACLNTYDEVLYGEMRRDSETELRKTVERLEAEHGARPTPENSNDLAVAHILLKNPEAAIMLLTALEKKTPGLSRTASNLGTALELAGRNKEALHWIKEGIVRNPADHEGTEWLHVKILEAKLALEKDPAWLKSHHVLGIDFGNGDRPVMPAALPVDHEGKERSFADTEKAIAYQMHERLRFVTPPDLLIGDIYLTRADMGSLTQWNAQDAFDYYVAAKFFGVADPELLERRAQQYYDDHEVHDEGYVFTEDNGLLVFFSIMGGLGGLVLAVIFWRRQRSKKELINENKEAA